MAIKLDIIFYGMSCFVREGTAYRVYFPNALQAGSGHRHKAGIWIRPRNVEVFASWDGEQGDNDFWLKKPEPLSIENLADDGPVDATAFDERVTNLKRCDPNFEIKNRKTAVEMLVDRGVLSSHQQGDEKALIVVRWQVQREPGKLTVFRFGKNFINVPPQVTQVMLVNASSSEATTAHFHVYRQLTEPKSGDLNYVPPHKKPGSKIELDDPSTIGLLTPDIMCSPVMLADI